MDPQIIQARKISKGLRPSRVWVKMVRRNIQNQFCTANKRMCVLEHWDNSVYQVNCRRFQDGWPLGDGPWVEIGIAHAYGEAAHDFRDMQNIKNDICGPEWEALEVFPAESRLIDPSNYYYLYCVERLPFGRFVGRTIVDENETLAPQRPWPASQKPKICYNGKY